MKIFLSIPGEEKLLGVEVNEESDNILGELKQQVWEKRKIPPVQQNIYAGSVLLTDEQDNSSVLIHLKRNNDFASLKILTLEQVALYQAIKALDLADGTKLNWFEERSLAYGVKPKYDGKLYITHKHDGQLKPLASALDALGIEYEWKHNPVDGYILRLSVSENDNRFQADFPNNLKTHYNNALAERQKSLFYINDSIGFAAGALAGVGGLGLAIAQPLIGVALIGGAATGIGGLIIIGIVAAILIGLSAFWLYQSVKSGKDDGGGNLLSSESESRKPFKMQHASDVQEKKDPSYTEGDVLKQWSNVDSKETPGQQATDPKKSSTPGLEKKG